MTGLRSLTILLAACGMAGCASNKPAPELPRPESLWSVDFQHPVAYHKLVGEDLLIIGTVRHLWGVDPRNGDRLWRLRNVNTNRRDVIEVPAASFLLINDAAGGAFDDAGTHVLAVDRGDGHLFWESPVLGGRILQARLDTASGRLYAVIVQSPHGDDRGVLSDLLPGKGLFAGLEREPELAALDLETGDLLWRRSLGDGVLMRPSYRPGVGDASGEGIRPFDLGIYHPPTLAAGQVCVTYTGVHCFDADSGRSNWHQPLDVVDGDLGRAYPNPVVNDGLLVAGDTERLFAFEPRSGDSLWRSEDLDRVPELLDDEVILFAQIGGQYFDLDSEEWVSRGPFAVAAVNKRNGNVLWRYDRLRASISNLMVAGYFVWVADEAHLYALDRLDGSVGLRVAHGLREPPLYVLLNDSQQIVLVSEREIAAFDADQGGRLWYHGFEAPGPGAWKQLAAALLNLSGGIFKLSSTIIAYGSGMLPSIPNLTMSNGRRLLSGKRTLEKATGVLGDKLSEVGTALGEEYGFANLTGKTQYFIARARGLDEFVLAAVDVDSGEYRSPTILPVQSPELVIDEVNGLIYQSRDRTVLAVPLGN